MLKLTNSICEALICDDWRLILVESVHGNDSLVLRCPECRASIKLMKQGKDGLKAHFVHDKRNPDCSLGDSMGKKLKYKHISVKVLDKDRKDSFLFENLIPDCIDNDAVINDGEISEDIIDVFASSLSDAEKRQEIKARVGQGQFRQNVIQVWGSEACALTLTPVSEMLVASHIKSWRNCKDTNERLDGANGILLCAHIDKLFDRHLITFKKVGIEYRVKFNSELDKSLMTQLGVNEGDALSTSKIKSADLERFEDHLFYHQKIFSQLNDINTQ
ncbi:MAG: HNH endonuclease [Shewanella sp.]|nr:HNH endonuclease [Shewanella sp.]